MDFWAAQGQGVPVKTDSTYKLSYEGDWALFAIGTFPPVSYGLRPWTP